MATTGSRGRPGHADDAQGDCRDEADARREPVEPVDEVDAVGHADDPHHHEEGAPDPLEADDAGPERVGDRADRDPEAHGDEGHQELPAELPARAEVVAVVQQPDQHRGGAAEQQGERVGPGDPLDRASTARRWRSRGRAPRHDEEGDAHRDASPAGHRARVDAALVGKVERLDPVRHAPDGRGEDEREDRRGEEGDDRGDEEARVGHRVVPGRRSVTPPAAPGPGSGRRCRAPPPRSGRARPARRASGASRRAGVRPRASRRERSRGSWSPASPPGCRT